MDDLLEGVITNKLTNKKKDDKQLGQTDLLVQQAYNDAMKDVKKDAVIEKVEKSVKPLSQEEQWKQLMNEPDPLEDQDIYAGEKKCEDTTAVQTANPEDTEMEDDLADALDKSF